MKVNSNHFQKSEIEKECTLKTFLKNLNFEPKKYNVFLNVCDVDRKKIGDIRDAILMKVPSIISRNSVYYFDYNYASH